LHLVGFVTRIYHDARTFECQNVLHHVSSQYTNIGESLYSLGHSYLNVHTVAKPTIINVL